MNLSRLLPYFLVLVCFWPVIARAEPLLLSPQTDRADLAGHLSVLEEDASRAYTAEQVLELDRLGRFQPLPGNLGMGYTRRIFWLRFEIQRMEPVPATWLLEIEPPYLDDLRLCQPDDAGVYACRRGGDLIPFSRREIVHRNTVFPLTLAEGRSVIYLRVQTTSTMAVIPRLWRPAAFQRATLREYLVWGGCFGILASTMAFGLLNGILARRKGHFHYALFALTFALETAATAGFFGELVFPDNPDWASAAVGICIGANIFSGYRLLNWFFSLRRRRWRQLVYVNRTGMILAVITAVSSLTPYYRQVAGLLGLYGILAMALSWHPFLDYIRSLEAREGRWLGGASLLFCAVFSINILIVSGFVEPTLVGIYAYRGGVVLFLLGIYIGVLTLIQAAERRQVQARAKVRDARQWAHQERRSREERESFLAMFNHEIRTPLSVIRAATQSLQVLDPVAGDERRVRYDRILDAVERTQRLVELCIASDRFDARQWKMAGQACDLVPLTRETLSLLGSGIEDRVESELPPAAPLQGDVELIRIAFLNLLDNAFKYATPDTPIRIALVPFRLADGREGYDWSISNEGAAWPEGDGERLFEKYFRVGEHLGQPGLGLGLFLVRRILEMHGGSVSAEIGGDGRIGFHCRFPAVLKKEEA